MAWVASNLFAQVESADALADALVPLLSNAEHGADREGLLGDPPPLTISAPIDGWSVVCGLRGFIDDMTWLGRELSRDDAVGRVVTSELIAQAFRLRHAVHDGGEAVGEIKRYPDSGWDAQHRTAGDAPMPLYRDVEQLAYALLLDLGIAHPLVLLGVEPADIGTVGDTSAPARSAHSVALDDGLQLARAADAFKRSALTLHGLDYDSSDAPVIPASVGLDFGLKLYDDRFLEGVPHDRAINRLVQLESKIEQRARAVYGVPELELTVTYHNAEYQPELDALLTARGRHVAIENTHRRDIPKWWEFWRYFGKFK